MLSARSALFSGLGFCVLSLSACDALDASKLDLLHNPIEMPPDDPERDAGPSEPECVLTGAELCNNKDDDCDDKIDEKADEACFLPSTNSVCATGGRCIIVSCDTGYVDCNDRDDDGCEHDLAIGPCPGECATCEDAGRDSGPEPQDAEVDEYDAGRDAEVEVDAGPTCTEEPETCDGEDNDCDDHVDEIAECPILECMATTPSYRGEACDRCVCEKCGTHLMQCQENPDTAWRDLCVDVVECYVVEDRAGRCGSNHDCYASGACDGRINLAAGGTSETDNIPAATGGCTATTPPTTACQAVTNYKNECINDLCMTECAD